MAYFKIYTQYFFLDWGPNIGSDISSVLNSVCLSLTYMNCHKILLLICRFWQQGCRVIFIQSHLKVENFSFVKICLVSVPLYLSACSCRLVLEFCPTVLCTFPQVLSFLWVMYKNYFGEDCFLLVTTKTRVRSFRRILIFINTVYKILLHHRD